MANRFPLIVNTTSGNSVQELPSGDFLDLSSSGIANSGNITVNTGSFFIGNGSQLTGLAATYGNANVVANLAALGSNPVSTTGTVTGSQFNGSGAGLTSIPGANVTGTLSIPTTSYAATVSGAAQANITSVGTLTSLAVTANVAGGNLTTAGQLVSTIATGTAPLAITSTTLVPNLYVARANVSDYDVVSTATTGTYYLGLWSAVTGNLTNSANTAFSVNAATGALQSTIMSASGNVTGGNILTGGLISAGSTVTGTSFLGAVVSVTANVTGGNLTTAGVLTVNSGAGVTAIVNGASNAVGNIGSSTTYFNRLFAQATTALYADLAEVYKADAQYPPGTVLVFGGTQEVTMSTESHDVKIAGVVSTHPAHVMNSGLQSEFTVEVGLIGRVPCRVIGPITAGDRVVSSNRAGVAERLDMSKYQPGVIIGKAVESYLDSSIGTIEVVVGRL